MRVVFCFLRGEMTSSIEERIMSYDNDETEIHIYTDTLILQQNMGYLLQEYDSQVRENSEHIIFLTDREGLYRDASQLYNNLFDQILLFKGAVISEAESCEVQDYSFLQTAINTVHKMKVECYESYCENNHMLAVHLQGVLCSYADAVSEAVVKLSEKGKFFFNLWLEEYIQDDKEENRTFRLYICGLLLKFYPSGKGVDILIHEISLPYYNVQNQYFIYQYVGRYFFLHPEFSAPKELGMLYNQILATWKTQLITLLAPIDYNKRNPNRVVVLTVQFLSESHAPTHTAEERIYTLGTKMNKEVLCINTREKYTKNGFLPLYEVTVRQVEEDLSGACRIQYKDFAFPFYQPSCEMPELQEYVRLIHLIREFNPCEIVVIGVDSILGDLCANMIPTVCIPVVFSTIPKKYGQFVATGKQITEEEKEKLVAAGYETDRIIESRFTFELKPQKRHVTRMELGIPQSRFVISMIGLRLDYDITKEFLETIVPLCQEGAYLMFAGYFKKYEDLCISVPTLRETSCFIGYNDDILSIMEISDLYVNPPRLGGGFSVIEAFSMGVPGVTLSYGDVAQSAGEDFRVESISEMIAVIRKYMTDKKFYQLMSKKARERASLMTDGETALKEILDKVESSPRFF